MGQNRFFVVPLCSPGLVAGVELEPAAAVVVSFAGVEPTELSAVPQLGQCFTVFKLLR